MLPAPRPILTLVTQTLRDVNALHGDLPDVVKALDDLSLDLLHHAKTPALASLARTLREHVFHLERAVDAEGPLPKDWAEAIGELPGLDEEDTSADIDSVEVMQKYATAAAVRVGEAALLREVLEQLGISGDDAHERFRDWVRDVGAQIERAKGIVDPADKIVGDADALREALGIAENAKQADPATPPPVDLSGELAAARESLVKERARAGSAEALYADAARERDKWRAGMIDVEGRVEALVQAVHRVLPPEATGSAASPPLPVAPDHMRLVGALGWVCDGPFGRLVLNEHRSVALACASSRYVRNAVHLVCSAGKVDTENVAGLAGQLKQWVDEREQRDRPLVHPPFPETPIVVHEGPVRKLPKASEETWKIGLVPIEADETVQFVHFDPALVRLACTGADTVRVVVFKTVEGADGKKAFALRIERDDEFLAFVQSRGESGGSAP